jgi:hypothetical protein
MNPCQFFSYNTLNLNHYRTLLFKHIRYRMYMCTVCVEYRTVNSQLTESKKDSRHTVSPRIGGKETTQKYYFSSTYRTGNLYLSYGPRSMK